MRLNYKLFLLCALSLFVIFSSYSFVLAQWGQPTSDWGQPSGGWGQPSGGNSIGNFLSSNSFIDLVNRIAGWIFTIAIPIAIIMIVWSGFLFMSAGGQEDKVTKAKRALTWSIVGLAIAFIGKGFSVLILEIIGGSPDQLTSQGIVNSLNKLASFMYYLGPAVAVIFLTWGGMTYMFAGGDEKKIEEAKKRLWWAIIGATVVIGAGVIIRTVITNLPVLQF